MKVFNLRKEKGGFTIESLGGGKHTKSLTIKDNKGKLWVLRNIDKEKTEAVPSNYQGMISSDLIIDLNSASHPYAALTVPDLAKSLNIPVAHPELFFVPDDPAFGFYRRLFAGKVCMLEEKMRLLEVLLPKAQQKSLTKWWRKMITALTSRKY